MLPQAEVYVYEDDKMIQGFLGVRDEYIEGIFVSDKMQSQGIGKILLNQGNVFLPKRRIYDPVGKDG